MMAKTHLVIFSRSGNEISLQIDNGEPVTVVANDRPVDRLELSIGAQKLGGNAFDGLIAEVRAFDDALTPEEAEALYGEFVATYDNQAPTANPDSYTLQEDATFFAVPLASGVLANDTDNEGDALTATLVDSTQNGRVTLNDDGTLIYIPDPDFSGVDTFTYSCERLSSIRTSDGYAKRDSSLRRSRTRRRQLQDNAGGSADRRCCQWLARQRCQSGPKQRYELSSTKTLIKAS